MDPWTKFYSKASGPEKDAVAAYKAVTSGERSGSTENIEAALEGAAVMDAWGLLNGTLEEAQAEVRGCADVDDE